VLSSLFIELAVRVDAGGIDSRISVRWKDALTHPDATHLLTDELM
jgi:hypothetical protein